MAAGNSVTWCCASTTLLPACRRLLQPPDPPVAGAASQQQVQGPGGDHHAAGGHGHWTHVLCFSHSPLQLPASTATAAAKLPLLIKSSLSSASAGASASIHGASASRSQHTPTHCTRQQHHSGPPPQQAHLKLQHPPHRPAAPPSCLPQIGLSGQQLKKPQRPATQGIYNPITNAWVVPPSNPRMIQGLSFAPATIFKVDRPQSIATARYSTGCSR